MRINISIIKLLFLFYALLVANITFGEPKEFVETEAKAKELVSKMTGKFAIEGIKERGSLVYIRNVNPVLIGQNWYITYETVVLNEYEKKTSEQLNIVSDCGVGRSEGASTSIIYNQFRGLVDLKLVYVVGESNVAQNVLDDNEQISVPESLVPKLQSCYEQLSKLHDRKNLLSIELHAKNGRFVNLSWFANEESSVGFDLDSEIVQIDDLEVIKVVETVKTKNLKVEVKRFSEMLCNQLDDDQFVNDWKEGSTSWLTLVRDGNMFQGLEQLGKPVFPKYSQSELDSILIKRKLFSSLNEISCYPLETDLVIRLKRDEKVIYKIRVSEPYGC